MNARRVRQPLAAEPCSSTAVRVNRQFMGLDDLLQPQFGWELTYVFREKTIKVLDEDQEAGRTAGTIAMCRTAGRGEWDQLVDTAGNSLYRLAQFNAQFLVCSGVSIHA